MIITKLQRLEVGLEGKPFLSGIFVHDSRALVVGDALFEEIGLALEGDEVHEIKGVLSVVAFRHAKGDEQAVSDKFNILAHEGGVHANETDSYELLLDGDGLSDDARSSGVGGPVLEQREEQTGEVAVQTFIARYELIREGKSGHKATLLEPEDGSEGAGEEDALDGRKGNQALGKRLAARNPTKGPLSFLPNARN
ncbi:hypothetical protein BC938DRAFT_478710 [Jimgerdemannia flammicorona]|uniref:Uncharacterized protein n=1 Tax=Jimgerdemannia flammicorona TaxID=994334 RepID=A0A433QMF9_9FUNG|nr:hypothetical protein BC938DRAFT_478710 [Jimgerdemannia flammicorona]